MTASPARVIADLLITDGLAGRPPAQLSGTLDWQVTVGFEPADPASAPNHLTVFDTDPVQEGRLMKTGERIEKSTVQVRVRAKDYLTGWAKGKAVQVLFDGLYRRAVTVPSTGETANILAVHVTMPVVRIGQDEDRRRQIFVLSAIVSFY